MQQRTTCAMQTASPATDMILRIFSSAVVAGGLAGLVAGALQLAFVQPVLLHAELYETGQLVHFGASSEVSTYQTVTTFDLYRDGLSLAFSELLFVGYAMLLLPLILVAEERYDQPLTARAGVLWGIAGFIAINMAPAFSMAPEVPGVAAADVGDRQIWWFATVVLAAAALWLLAFVRHPGAVVLAIVLFLAPHIYGAPEPAVFLGPVPPEIAAKFAARALGASLAAWVVLGSLVSAAWVRGQGAELSA